MSSFDPQPVIFESEFVRIEPMTLEHAEDLMAAGSAPELWRFIIPNRCETLESTKHWINFFHDEQKAGKLIPFVIFDKKQQKIVGQTTYVNIDRHHKGIEVGYTFIQPNVQRSGLNRQCKYMLITHAFENLGANRVQLQTSEKNDKSRNAILGIGAKFEGIRRYDRIQGDGSIRSSAYFSIIKPEWRETKQALIDKMSIRGQTEFDFQVSGAK